MNLVYISTLTLNAYFSVALTVSADSWTLSQSVVTSSGTTWSQYSSNGSMQAGNAIVLDNLTGHVVSADQQMSTGGNDLTLLQDHNDSSRQAVNFISAGHITEAQQSVANVGKVTLAQRNGGNNNVQALNMAVGTGAGTQIESLNQSVDAESVTFEGSGSGNIQAGNYLQADAVSGVAGNVVQNFSVSGNVDFIQNGVNNVQAGNVLIKNSATFAGEVTQNFSASNVQADYSSTDSNGSVKAANYVATRP